MENNGLWWYGIPFCLGAISLFLTLYGYHERTAEQDEPPVEVIKTVATEHEKTDIPIGKIRCVSGNNGYCREYVIYRTVGE